MYGSTLKLGRWPKTWLFGITALFIKSCLSIYIYWFARGKSLKFSDNSDTFILHQEFPGYVLFNVILQDS